MTNDAPKLTGIALQCPCCEHAGAWDGLGTVVVHRQVEGFDPIHIVTTVTDSATSARLTGVAAEFRRVARIHLDCSKCGKRLRLNVAQAGGEIHLWIDDAPIVGLAGKGGTQ